MVEKPEVDWFPVIMALCSDDLTKADKVLEENHIFVLNWLSYLRKKQKEQERQQIINNMKNRR